MLRLRFIHDDDQQCYRCKSLLSLRVAAAPGDLLHIGSLPMEGIAFVAGIRIPARRRSQRDSRDFRHGLLEAL